MNMPYVTINFIYDLEKDIQNHEIIYRAKFKNRTKVLCLPS